MSCGMDAFSPVVDLLTMVCAAYAAIGVHRLQRSFDVLKGRVDTHGEDLRAHVNAPGLHR